MSDALKWRSLISKLRFRLTMFCSVLLATMYRSRAVALHIVLLTSSLLTFSNASELSLDQTEAVKASVSIIVNQGVQVDEASLRDLRAIYSMKKRFWTSQQAITVYVLSNDHSLHNEFCKKQLGIFPNQLESIWYRQVYTGTGKAPLTVSSKAEMIKKVAATPGAIGYIDNNNIEQMQADENIKTLSIR
jgi:ABC-type phosphate transport system substrate-binding protein